MEYIPFSNPQGVRETAEAPSASSTTNVINTNVIHVDGRYPTVGWESNEDCRTVLCVSHKRGRVIVRSEAGEVTTDITADGVVILDPNEEYVREGQMKLFRVMTRLAVTEFVEEADSAESTPE